MALIQMQREFAECAERLARDARKMAELLGAAGTRPERTRTRTRKAKPAAGATATNGNANPTRSAAIMQWAHGHTGTFTTDDLVRASLGNHREVTSAIQNLTKRKAVRATRRGVYELTASA